MNNEVQDLARDEDAAIGRLLGAVAGQSRLPEPMRQRWSARFETEMRAVVRARKRRRLGYIGLAMAASVAALLVWVPGRPEPRPLPAPAVALARVDQFVHGAMRQAPGEESRPLRDGDSLRVGDVVDVAPAGRMVLQVQGLRLRVDGNSRLRFAAGRVELLSGQIYAEDSAPAVPARSTPVLRARGVEVRHVGTQFLLSLEGESVRAMVRDGAILLSVDGRELRAEASATAAQQVDIGKDRDPIVTEVATHGPAWEWIHALAPPLVIDGVAADEFLRRAGREAGFSLRYETDAARVRAQTVLGGTLPPLPPLDAIDAVAAYLELEVLRDQSNVLRIRLRG